MNQITIERRTSSVKSLLCDDALLNHIYANRGVQDADEIHLPLSRLLSYHSLLHIDHITDRLIEAFHRQAHILIIGDFDTDGATSTALAVSALRMLGFLHVSYLIPNRFTDGYGLSVAIVDAAMHRFNPDILITVDHGISSVEGVLQAKKHGMQVYITDHHLPGQSLPDADVIVNPNQPGDVFPSKHLAGVGVIFYVMLALRAQMKKMQYLAHPVRMDALLDLVALGTIADVVPLDMNNRILVHHGLLRMRKGLARPGIKALLQNHFLQVNQVSSTDLAYQIAPKLNAAGRLTDMSLGVACLLCSTVQEAMPKAHQLMQLNTERKSIEKRMYQEAIAQMTTLESPVPLALCLFDPTWHQGLIGIIAGRLKEKWHRPACALAETEPGILKGSCRSIPGIHVRDILQIISNERPDILTQFGGHAMAAGLSIEKKNLAIFQKLWLQVISQHAHDSVFRPVIYTDGSLPMEELNLEKAVLLSIQHPWGQGFPPPIFDDVFWVHQQTIVGRALHLSVEPYQAYHLRNQSNNAIIHSDSFFNATLFQFEKIEWPRVFTGWARLVYQLSYRKKKPFLLVEHIQQQDHVESYCM